MSCSEDLGSTSFYSSDVNFISRAERLDTSARCQDRDSWVTVLTGAGYLQVLGHGAAGHGAAARRGETLPRG